MNRPLNRQINHKTLRIVVGLIAFLLTPSVYLLANTHHSLDSISISYWTDAGDVFVGALIAVGFFLFAYNGNSNGRDLEFYVNKTASLCAVVVALFPTKGQPITNASPPAWTVTLSNAVGLQPHHIHYGAAVLLFVCLITMMWFFSIRANQKGKPGRALTYRTISVLMAAGIVGLSIYGNAVELNNTVLLVEIWGLTLFGTGWFIAGAYRTQPTSGGVKSAHTA